jgi:cysteine-rich repeat protein
MKKSAPVVAFVGALVSLGAAAIVLPHCGGSVCGNGKTETGEQCDQGDRNGKPGVGCSAECKLISVITAKLNVSWTRLSADVPSYPNYPDATCAALGIDRVRVDVAGPSAQTMELPCAQQNSILLGDVAAGSYTVTLTMLDSTGKALTTPKSSMPTDVQATGQQTEVRIELTKDDYVKQDYTGTLYFLPNWGMTGGTCASQNVGETSVWLTPRGSTTPVTKTTSTTPMRMLDGTRTPGCFVPAGNDLTEKAPTLPWGHYDMTITGRKASSAPGTIDFCGKYGVFVGPGVANPSFQLVVPAAAAGVDGGAGACP